VLVGDNPYRAPSEESVATTPYVPRPMWAFTVAALCCVAGTLSLLFTAGCVYGLARTYSAGQFEHFVVSRLGRTVVINGLLGMYITVTFFMAGKAFFIGSYKRGWGFFLASLLGVASIVAVALAYDHKLL
jgi:hypothetical protein